MVAGHGVAETLPTDHVIGRSIEPAALVSAFDGARRRMRRLIGAGLTPSLGHFLDLNLSGADVQVLGLRADDDDVDDDDADDFDDAEFEEP